MTLMFASVSERIIFKVTVDGMAPFRAVLLLLILLTSIFAFACIAIGKRLVYVIIILFFSFLSISFLTLLIPFTA